VGLALSFAGDTLLEALGVHDYLEKKFSFMPDEYTDVARAVRSLVNDYLVVAGGVELAARDDESLKAVGAKDPDAARKALARAVEAKRPLLADKERDVMGAFSNAYAEAKTGHAGLEELDSLRDQFLTAYHAVHQGGDAANEPIHYYAGGPGEESEEPVGADIPTGSTYGQPVSKKELKEFFEGIDATLSIDGMSEQEVAAMPQWSKLDEAIHELEGLLYVPGSPVDWKAVNETESHVTLMLHNAHYRLAPKDAGFRHEPLASSGAATAAYKKELQERESKFDVLHQRLLDAAAGIELAIPPPPGMETQVPGQGEGGAPPAPPVGADIPTGSGVPAPQYGDVDAAPVATEVLQQAKASLERFDATLDAMPPLPYGAKPDEINKDATMAANYGRSIEGDAAFKDALFKLKAVQGAMVLLGERAQRVAGQDRALTADVGDLRTKVRAAIKRRLFKGYRFPDEVDTLVTKTKEVQAKSAAVKLGEAPSTKPLTPSEEAAAAESKDTASLGTISNRLQKIPNFHVGGPSTVVTGVSRVVGSVVTGNIEPDENVLVGVIESDPIPIARDNQLKIPSAKVLPLNPAAIARLGPGVTSVPIYNLEPITTEDLDLADSSPETPETSETPSP
jgi:hypothetical protein